ncbi:aminotransferase class I/II-fold pyridoxal phosphate-dependent enzyme [Rasiella sp. SM2506]|uniref:aminotransferase class I/II-fold pyridoxal phosphate-dependent enzyme n=1 Tax=Rasiella sp. SM2506 TaxID=3423914 RepID=UPI003D7903C0
MLPKKLQRKLEKRATNNSLRSLGTTTNLIDFSSNDYLGFSTSLAILNRTSEILKEYKLQQNGATGSRLLSGNHKLYALAEQQIAQFHNVESALIFNSGYDANIGFFSSVPQRGDLILYDELCHASIRDGIKMSDAKAYKFKHNDLEELQKKINSFLPFGEMPAGQRGRSLSEAEVYIVTESIFSMDGDQPDLKKMAALSKKLGCHLVIDEAHAFGVFGKSGEGLVQELELENEVFARLITFGKALGCHGAAILGSAALKQYLVNFARSFVYTTALPPHSVATICSGYEELAKTSAREKLHSNIAIVQNEIIKIKLQDYFISSNSAIHSCIVPGNEQVKKVSEALKKEGFDVKPILSPTVPKGQERLRICVHSFNTEEDIKTILNLIKTIV